MDNTTRVIAEYAAGLGFEELPEEVIHAASRLMVDSLACASAAFDCEPAAIGRRIARGGTAGRYAGRILGFPERSTAEGAAFVNTAMIRNLDFNDHYPGGHPSDCLGALLAIAESAGADGRRLLASMVVAYEMFIRLSDATKLRERGWDQGFAIGVSTAAAVGNLLGLSAKVIGEAVAITTVANVPMRNTRAGELSLWKGAATAYAARNGLFGALLAGEGMTGPDRPFEGHHGLWEQITGPFELPAFGGRGGDFRIPVVQMKYWPVEYNAQAAVWAALELRSMVGWTDLAEIDIATYAFAWSEIGSGPERWDPKTRETADHSLPYIFARTLVDGTIGPASFEEAAYLDPSLRPLMAKIRVRKDDAIQALYPENVILRLQATTAGGGRFPIEIRNPVGHNHNPMKDEDVREKFLRAANPVLGLDRAAAALETWWNIREPRDFPGAFGLLEMNSA